MLDFQAVLGSDHAILDFSFGPIGEIDPDSTLYTLQRGLGLLGRRPASERFVFSG